MQTGIVTNYNQLVVGVEILEILVRLLTGFEVTNETLVDLIRRESKTRMVENHLA
jgi:hypothetical protein